MRVQSVMEVTPSTWEVAHTLQRHKTLLGFKKNLNLVVMHKCNQCKGCLVAGDSEPWVSAGGIFVGALGRELHDGEKERQQWRTRSGSAYALSRRHTQKTEERISVPLLQPFLASLWISIFLVPFLVLQDSVPGCGFRYFC